SSSRCPRPPLTSHFFFSGTGDHRDLHSFPTRRSSDLLPTLGWVQNSSPIGAGSAAVTRLITPGGKPASAKISIIASAHSGVASRSEEHTSELQSRENLVCRLLLEKKKKNNI